MAFTAPASFPIGRPRLPCRLRAATVVLTRQAESNHKAREALQQRGVVPIELPLIEFKSRPEAQYLTELLAKRRFDWVAITSPHSAEVVAGAWRAAGRPEIRAATFASTQKSLPSEPGFRIGFVPTVSNAEHLAAELPKREDVCEEILYPASSKADNTLERALRGRHFVVTRLDTYETGTVDPEALDATALEKALDADVLTFASPTAVRAWVDVAQANCDFHTSVACIGATTAKAAREMGFSNVYYAQNPGLDGLVQSVMGVLRERGKLTV